MGRLSVHELATMVLCACRQQLPTARSTVRRDPGSGPSVPLLCLVQAWTVGQPVREQMRQAVFGEHRDDSGIVVDYEGDPVRTPESAQVVALGLPSGPVILVGAHEQRSVRHTVVGQPLLGDPPVALWAAGEPAQRVSGRQLGHEGDALR
jgi:hypothetical protein